MQSQLSSERSSHIIHSLHALLKPFLLRRLKVDVETSLPPKKEYVLYAPLSVRQNEVYDKVVTGGLRAFLMGKGKGGADGKGRKKKTKIDIDAPRRLRASEKGKERKRYDVDGDDDEYFEKLEQGDEDDRQKKETEDVEEIGRTHQYKATRRLFCRSVRGPHSFSLRSQASQQYEIAKHGYAASQSLLASIPI